MPRIRAGLVDALCVLIAKGLEAPVVRGLAYNPLADTWSLGADTDVNYLACAAKPA